MGRIGRTANISLIDTGMDDDGCMKSVEDTVFTHINFTTTDFFGRQHEPSLYRRTALAKSQGRRDTHGGNNGGCVTSVSDFRRYPIPLKSPSEKAPFQGFHENVEHRQRRIVDGKTVVGQDVFQ